MISLFLLVIRDMINLDDAHWNHAEHVMSSLVSMALPLALPVALPVALRLHPIWMPWTALWKNFNVDCWRSTMSWHLEAWTPWDAMGNREILARDKDPGVSICIPYVSISL